MGRPKAIQIDKQRLRGLREEKGWTQREFGKRLAQKFGLEQDETTSESIYRYIENNGKTSSKRASAVACLLDVSLDLILGIEAPSPAKYIDRIGCLLKRQLLNPNNRALKQRYEALLDDGEEKAIQELANDIGQQIESVQLGRDPVEIAELSELTGLSDEELLRPANILGHWLLIISSVGLNKTEIAYGVADVGYRIKKAVADHLDHFGSDGSIRMWHDSHWMRLEIARPGRHPYDLIRISFTRCQADADGIKWSKALWHELFLIEHDLHEWANTIANFVTDFKGRTLPTDVERLRFLITEHNGSYSHPTRKMIANGHFHEIDKMYKENSVISGRSHALYVNWLEYDMLCALLPHISEFSAEYWKVGGSDSIDISLSLPFHLREDMSDGIRYRISLVEETSSGELVFVPWREKDKDALREKLRKHIQNPAPYDHIGADYSLPKFEPV